MLSGVNLSELTALVSSGALALAFLNLHILERSAEVGFSPLTCNESTFSLAVINEGTRPAVLRRAVATRTIDGTRDERPVELELSGAGADRGDPILQPGQGRTLLFAPTGLGFAPKPSTAKLCYSVEVTTVEFTGKAQSDLKPCPCV